MIITCIVTVDQMNGMSFKGGIPWNIDDYIDFLNYKTRNSPILMGKKAYSLFGDRLKSKYKYVLSRDDELIVPGAKVVNSVHHISKKFINSRTTLYILGGSSVYYLFYHSTLYYCIVKYYSTYVCDNYFPSIHNSALARRHFGIGKVFTSDGFFTVYGKIKIVIGYHNSSICTLNRNYEFYSNENLTSKYLNTDKSNYEKYIYTQKDEFYDNCGDDFKKCLKRSVKNIDFK